MTTTMTTMTRNLFAAALLTLPAVHGETFESIAKRSPIDLTVTGGACSATVLRHEPGRLVLKLTTSGPCGRTDEIVFLPRTNIQSIFGEDDRAGEVLRAISEGATAAIPAGLGAAAIGFAAHSPNAGRAVFAVALAAKVISMFRNTPRRYDVIATGVQNALTAPPAAPATAAPAPAPATAARPLLRSDGSVRE